MALQQPSMDNLATGLRMVSHELVLFQNLPAVADGRGLRDEIQMLEGRMNTRFDQVLNQLQRQQDQLQRQQDQLQRQQDLLERQQDQLERLQEAVNHVRGEFDLQPMKFYNVSASITGTLKGPNGPIPDGHPNKRDALLAATTQQCIALSQYLALQPLPVNTPVQVRREQIAKFLGVVL